MAGQGTGRGRRTLALLASSSCVALLIGGGAMPAMAGACYTGPFPVTNLAAQTCISATGTSFSGNITNAASGTITAGPTAPTNIGIAVSNSTINGAIINLGSISAPSGDGIRVFDNAVLSGGISNSGTISVNGTAAAITVTGVSTFNGGISNSGTLSAPGVAIFVGATGLGTLVSTFSGGITNAGTISAGATGILVNIVSVFSGGITNSSTISAATDGIKIFAVSTFTGGVTNSGLINSPGFSAISVAGVSTFAGGIVNIGTLSAGAAGISVGDIGTFSQGISNGGGISGISGINVTGVDTFQGGITNSGTIAGSANGIVVANVGTFTGGITNSGMISGLFGIQVGTSCGCSTIASFSGGIANSGTIAADLAGISVFGVSLFSGRISNGGLISVTGGGIELGNVSTFTGGITNSGTITGGAFGIEIFGVTNFSGGITNTGTIAAGNSGIIVDEFATFADGITNSGTITAAAFGITVRSTGPRPSGVAFAGGIANTGTIAATFSGISVVFRGTFSGGISNAGLITMGHSGVGISVQQVSLFTGGISNSGTITGGAFGIDICDCVGTFTNGITNSGLIAGRFGGISVSATSFDGGILNTGTIAGGRTGISVTRVGTFTGGITNSGMLSGRFAGIAVRSSGFLIPGTRFTGGIINTGTISAAFSGIAVATSGGFGGGITNAGLISMSDAGIGVGITVDQVTTFTRGITNSGTITGGAAGVVICGCVGTFTGGIINTGMIAAHQSGILVEATSFDGHIVNSGTISAVAAINLSIAQNAITIDQNAGLIAGDIRLSRFGDTLNVRGGTINGDIVGQNAGDTINFALGAANTFTYDAAFGFFNVINVNVDSGVVVLNGNNHAGNVAVNGGVLQVGDAAHASALLAGSVDVIGGTLSGHGTVFGDVTIENGGVLLPGGSIGTLTVANGPLTFRPGSTYLVQIAPGAGDHSATAATGAPGNVVINGGAVLVLPQFGHYTAARDTIISSTGGVSGTFAGLSFAAPFAFTGTTSLSYDPNDVFLNLTDGFVLFAPTGLNQNQQGVVNGINGAIISGTTLPAQFLNLTSLSGPTLLNALSQLSGEDSAGFVQGALQAGNSFLSLLLNPYIDGRGDAFTPAIPFAAEARPALPDAALAFAKFVKADPRDATLGSVPQFRVWGAAYGGSGTVDGNAAVGSQRTTASDAAFAAGVDYVLSPNTTVGFALAGGGTNWGLDGGLGNGRSDFFQAGIYARQRFGDAYLAGALAYNFHDVTTNRTVTVAGTDMLQGRFQANGLGARIEGGYHVAAPFVRLTPYGAVQVQSIFIPSYGETATAGSNQFALNYASQTATTTRTELGSLVDRSLLDHGHLWTFYGRLAWAHDFGNSPSASAIFQALPGSNFIVNGAAPNADSALVTAGTKYDLLNGWSFQVKFDGEFSSNASIYSGTGMVRKTW